MADFSFSFDSDNPFAEPEPATPAAPNNGANPNGANANGANGNGATAPANAAQSQAGEASIADADAAFGLDDFDFDDFDAAPTAAPGSETAPESEAAPVPETAGDAFDFDFVLPETESAELPAPIAQTPAEPAGATGATPVQEPFPIYEGNAPPPADFGIETDLLDIPTLEENAPAASAGDFDFSLGDEGAATAPVAPAIVEEPTNELSIEDAPILAATPKETATETEADPDDDEAAEPRRRAPLPVPRVAILGASGIGKNHARWFHRNGAQIVAFLGTSEDSIKNTWGALSAEFPFEGAAYTDLSKLLEVEHPDIVCVATPPALHFGHVLQSLEAGAHVLCEKPLVYAPTRKFRENRDGAKELVKVAGKKNLVLGTQLQYGAATPILCKLAGLAPNEVGDFAMEIETMNPGSSRDPRELWIDLGPHPVSVAQMLAGEGATLAEETIRFEPHTEEGKTEVLTRWGINCADGRLLMVRAIVRALDPGTTKRKPRRRFSFNGHPIIYAPLNGPRGNFQAQFIAPDGYSSVYPDPVDYLVGNFVRACRGASPLLISGDFGRENLEWMLKIGTPAEGR